MKIPGWLSNVVKTVVLPAIKAEVEAIVKAEIDALRKHYGPAVPVPPGTTGPDVLTEVKR